LARKRRLHVLFVRPGEERGLPKTLGLGPPRERGTELPFGLLRLASAAKFKSDHRVSVHDERSSGTTKLRSAASIHRPDVAVVWLHPALLAAGLESARAVRHAGCPLVLGTGPMVDVWASGARKLPELDGLLPSNGASQLLAGLEVISRGGSALELSRTLGEEGPSPHFPRCLDRKLVDYAAYGDVSSGWPPTQLPPPSRLLGIGSESDKGRFAASRVTITTLAGDPVAPKEALEDIGECELLGIPWQELRPLWGCASHDTQWWRDLFALLQHRRTGRREVPTQFRLHLQPKVARSLPLSDLRQLSIVSIDLGEVTCSRPDEVEEALSAVRATRRSGIKASLTAVLGSPGDSVEDEERGLRQLESGGTQLDAYLQIKTEQLELREWSSWLEAPKPDFLPPGIHPEKLHLVEAVLREKYRRETSAPRAQALGRRLKAWIGTS